MADLREAADLFRAGYHMEYGKVTLFFQGGKHTHTKVEHDVRITVPPEEPE